MSQYTHFLAVYKKNWAKVCNEPDSVKKMGCYGSPYKV